MIHIRETTFLPLDPVSMGNIWSWTKQARLSNFLTYDRIPCEVNVFGLISGEALPSFLLFPVLPQI